MKVEWLEVGPSVRRLLREVPVDPPNQSRSSRATSGSYLLLRNDTISTQTGEDQRSGQETGGRPKGGVGIKVGHYQETPRLHESKINQKRAILAQLQVRERDE